MDEKKNTIGMNELFQDITVRINMLRDSWPVSPEDEPEMILVSGGCLNRSAHSWPKPRRVPSRGSVSGSVWCLQK